MAAISASLVKELRDRTGLGMLDCKRALKDAEGDIEKAIDELRKSSGMKAAKKAGRVAAEGVVLVRAADGYAQVLEVNSETDFVARDDSFKAFAGAVADKAFAGRTTDVAAVMAGDLENSREALVQKIGENISPRRIGELTSETVGSYVHGNERIAVLVALKGGDQELAKDVAMHVAAVNPQFVAPENVSEEVIAKESDIIKAQPDMAGKPENIVDKMIQGRIKKFLSEISLTEQAFVKNPELTVGKLVKDAGAEVVDFVRFEVGDGIEKEEKDFATEVAEQLAGK
ncbi:Elongation factor Ts [BD1-7 clade bacterium]|uniref:Elongation factor Ts n=1 Tax=BD1-7 clade bacterium TaxID=2029982 RepID=A0A5S9QMC7_9GAMM|nr:Elongation factor Ts [BD1-7 clade bacterium]CAA0119301.1 Elongation factor Ts [BD1-7 clade bacterium]